MRSKKAFYNIGSNLILQFIAIIYGFIVPKIIISNYGSDVNGLVSSITQFLAYITLLESGFGPVVKSVLYKPIAKKNKKEIASILKTTEKFFRMISKIFLVYIFVLSVTYPLIVNNNFGYLYTLSLVVIISISTFAEYYFGMTYRLYLQAEQKTYIISIIQIISYILSIALIVICAMIGTSIHVIKLVGCLSFILRPMLQNMYVKRKYNINLNDSTEEYKIKNKWDGLAQHIAAVIHGNTDITIITFFCKISEVSVYSVYYLVVRGIKTLIQSFTSGIDALFGNMLANNEKENLEKKFNMYEVLYFMICTIAFTCSIILITPFISVYTKGINDVNYIRTAFGFLIVISEYIWAIRLPYSSLTLAAGHFKETRIGAWVECISNIIISIILVLKFGIVGVAIGTIISMIIRTCEFLYHTNKYILNRPLWSSLKKILLVMVETVLIVEVSNYLPYLRNIGYINWFINAIMTAVCATVITIVLNLIFYRNEFKSLMVMIKSVLKRKVKK